MHFREWKSLFFYETFTELCSQGSNWQQPSIGLDNGLAPDMRQAIIWTIADTIYGRIYAALGGDELILTTKHTEDLLLLALCDRNGGMVRNGFPSQSASNAESASM